MTKPMTSRSKKNGNKKKTGAISIKARKAKARRLQNWCAMLLAKITGLKYGPPNDDVADYKGRQMGQSGADVVMSKEANNLTPFDIECKYVEDFSWGQFLNAVEQAQRNKKRSNYWLMVYKKNRMKPIIVMDAEKFFEIWEKVLYGNR